MGLLTPLNLLIMVVLITTSMSLLKTSREWFL